MFRWVTDLASRIITRLLRLDRGDDPADFMLDIERLDREQPGWDDQSKSVSAEFIMLHGHSRETAARMFGENAARLAWERMNGIKPSD